MSNSRGKIPPADIKKREEETYMSKKKARTSIYLDEEDLNHLKIISIIEDKKVNDIINKLIKTFLADNLIQLEYKKGEE